MGAATAGTVPALDSMADSSSRGNVRAGDDGREEFVGGGGVEVHAWVHA